MTESCERCQERLGELLQWEIDNPSLALLAANSTPASALASAPSPDQGRLHFTSTVEEEDQAELSPEQLRALWQHAQSCDECASALETLREARQVLGTLPTQAAPPDLRARIQAQLALSHTLSQTPVTMGNPLYAGSPSHLNGAPTLPEVPVIPVMPVAAAPAAMRAASDYATPAASGVSRARWQERAQSARAAEGEKKVIQRRVPRAVWAGGTALAAAFCLVLALRTEPTTSMAPSAVSESQVDAGSSGAAISSAPAPAPDGKRPKVAGAKPVAPGKAARKGAPAKASRGAASAPNALPDPSQDLPDPLPDPALGVPGAGEIPDALPDPGASSDPVQANPGPSSSTSAQADPPVPQLPRVPAPKAPKPKRAAPFGASTSVRPAPQSPQARTDAGRAQKQNPARSSAPEAPGTPATGSDASARRVAASSPPLGEAASISVQVAPADPAPTSAPLREGNFAGGSTNARDNDSGASSASGGSSSANSSSDQAAPSVSGTRPRNNRVRGGSPLEAAPAPAPGLSQESEGAPPSPATPNVAPVAPVVKATSVPPLVRRATIEIKPRRDVLRADVEVVLGEGWQFAGGQARERSRVVWLGSARKGEPVRIEIELQASSPKASARAARVRLLDTSNRQRREVGGADVSIPAR